MNYKSQNLHTKYTGCCKMTLAYPVVKNNVLKTYIHRSSPMSTSQNVYRVGPGSIQQSKPKLGSRSRPVYELKRKIGFNL